MTDGSKLTSMDDSVKSFSARITQSESAKTSQIGQSQRKQCEHVWEYCSGPDSAANWLCSRCEAEMVAPVATPK